MPYPQRRPPVPRVNRFTATMDRLLEEQPIVITRVCGSDEPCDACRDDRPLPMTRIVCRSTGASVVVCRGCRARLMHALAEPGA